MSNHVVIEFDPSAQYEWNRCAIRSLFSHGDVDLKQLVAAAIDQKPGHYLAKITVCVEVLEHQPIQESEFLAAEATFAQEQKDHLAAGIAF